MGRAAYEGGVSERFPRRPRRSFLTSLSSFVAAPAAVAVPAIRCPSVGRGEFTHLPEGAGVAGPRRATVGASSDLSRGSSPEVAAEEHYERIKLGLAEKGVSRGTSTALNSTMGASTIEEGGSARVVSLGKRRTPAFLGEERVSW